MFCGECGATVAVPRLIEPQTRTRPGDTAIIQPLDLNASVPEFLEPDFGATAREAVVSRPDAPVVPEAEPATAEPTASTPTPTVPPLTPPAPTVAARIETTPAARVETTPSRPVAPLVVPIVAPTPVRAPAPAPVQPPVPTVRLAAPAPAVAPVAAPASAASAASAAPASTPAQRIAPTPPLDAAFSSRAAFDSDHDDVEATRIVRNRQGDRFVLQFSTGENSTVFGTGLIGRNPVVQPGEFVDQLVAIVDPGKSVSKTHLEFGQAAGVFWIIDRFSANGTVVRQPDARPQRLDPGKRQILARGTRVDIGEQFFVVS